MRILLILAGIMALNGVVNANPYDEMKAKRYAMRAENDKKDAEERTKRVFHNAKTKELKGKLEEAKVKNKGSMVMREMMNKSAESAKMLKGFHEMDVKSVEKATDYSNEEKQKLLKEYKGEVAKAGEEVDELSKQRDAARRASFKADAAEHELQKELDAHNATEPKK